MPDSLTGDLRLRVDDRIAAWRVTPERTTETGSSVLVFGHRADRAVVLKVIKRQRDEWLSGRVLQCFDGRGVVRLLEHEDGALLLEWLKPGESLVSMAVGGCDRQATELLANVIRRMPDRDSPDGIPTVEDLGRSFDRCPARGGNRIPQTLCREAAQLYRELCVSQRRPRLLHGDLHHANVLLDSVEGWVAVDPKGVFAELEYEVGAALRNPLDAPHLFLRPETIGSRIRCFADQLHLNPDRMIAWTFAQAILSAIWLVEDGGDVGAGHPWIALAYAVRPMLKREFGT